MELSGAEFIRRFLQHVLPHRFLKLRYYGFFRSQQRPQLQQLKASLSATPPVEDPLPDLAQNQNTPSEPEPRPKAILCPGVDTPCNCSNNCRARNSPPALLDPSGLREPSQSETLK